MRAAANQVEIFSTSPWHKVMARPLFALVLIEGSESMSVLEEVYENLPADPEEAFLVLEAKFRTECESQMEDREQHQQYVYVEYIAQVIGAINALGLEGEFRREIPSIEDVDYSTFLNFSKDVKHYRTMLQIRNGRRAQGFSVRFDAASQLKLKHHLDQFRSLVKKLEVEENKRTAILDRVTALERELDHSKTRYDEFGALVIETAGVLGEAAEQLDPLRKILDSIAGVIWGKKQEEQKSLPAPKEPKRLEPPKAPQPRPTADDSDIPF